MKKIAIIFDFDETLVEESTSAFLESKGVDIDKFWGKTVKSLIDEDWDPVPAYMFKMIELSLAKSISKSDLTSFAKELKYKKGVKQLFANLKEYISTISSTYNIEYYIISSGIGDVIRNSSIAKNFTDIWASEFQYDLDEQIIFPKKGI